MDQATGVEPVLARFRATLDELYGSRLRRVVLFGSRVRGDALPDRWVELDRLADLRVRFIDETGAFFDAKPYPADACRDPSPLMHEIRREGREV